MGGPFRRLFGRLSESDEDRLAQEIRSWASDIPDTVRIVDGRCEIAGAAAAQGALLVPADSG